MKSKKVLALLLTAAMTVGILTGCGNKEDGNKSSEETKNQTQVSSVESSASESVEEPSLYNVGSLPIVNEPVTLKVLASDQVYVGYTAAEDSKYWSWLEEKTGIHFEVESYSVEELKTKLPLIMTDPDQMPDLFINCPFVDADVLSYGISGQLLKLNDLIDEYGSNIKTMFEECDTAYGASIAANGDIYAMPAMNGSASSVVYSMRVAFLEKAGLKVPTTLEELRDDMLQMRKMDLDGDGKAGNEILWVAQPKGFKRQALSMVGISAYWPWQGCIFDDHDGEVFFVPTSDEYKYLLGILNELYTAGCIDQEIFTQTYDEYLAKSQTGSVFISEGVDDPEEPEAYRGEEGWQYAVPLTSAVHDTPLVTVGADYQTFVGAVSTKTEYPEICTLVLDYMYSEEASMVARYGLEGVDYTVVTEKPFTINWVNGEDGRNNLTSILAPRWVREDKVLPATTALKVQRDEITAEYGKFGWQNYVHLNVEESETVTVLSTDLGLYCDDYFVGFITGTYNLEKDWDAYVAECNKMGAEDLVKVYQNAYDVFFNVK